MRYCGGNHPSPLQNNPTTQTYDKIKRWTHFDGMRVDSVGVELAGDLQEHLLGLLRGHALDAARAARRAFHRLTM